MAKRQTAAEASQPKPQTKAGVGGRSKVTPAFIEAGKKNLAKQKADKAKAKAAAKESGVPLGEKRWAQLLDGTLSVRDLDEQEIAKCRVRDGDGGFNGPGRRLPSHLVAQFQQEAIRRANEQFRQFAPQAVKRLLEIAEDVDTKDTDAIRALGMVLERALGKTPETIRLEGVSKFDQVTMEALGLDRDMADDA